MPHPAVFSAEVFWQFSLNHYARAGVEHACLTLQNTYQGNVNLALLLHWLDTLHIELADQQIHALIASLVVSDKQLQQYRTMRQRLKPQLAPAGYQLLLDFELELEKSQQHELLEQLNLLLPLPAPAAGTVTSNNLARYCQQLGATSLLSHLQGK
ncbi:TIGR02444 family protein [Photobacterium proteolyticum]|uniref:TIGR02444 family protein n=1 Tax=Photobacterium proteolyticum TaxID=1903952 RepID=A0A1Q9GUI3_9GAMM|nr:TIGR02444 family protein [Photobacterium proteolyticum]OLQ78799.1 TIGR02444 family protein [Photobacterium proteolyticum]